MEPISTTILTYVALKFVDQFLKEEGYGRLKKWLFPEKKYQRQLVSIIYKTIEEHEKLYPYKNQSNKFPFYHSQVLFEELNKHILFKTQYSSTEELLKKLEKNSNILLPSKNELDNFYGLLVSKINDDKKLINLFIEESYKSKIFETYQSIEALNEKLTSIEGKVTELDNNLIFQPNGKWFEKQCQGAILDLGNRYTPELNFELEVASIFDGLGRTLEFEKSITKHFDELLIKGKKF